MEQIREPNNVRIRVGRNVFDTPPKVSVIINAFNKAPYIRETLGSVIAQKFREHEIIVVNDGSDDTQELERELRTRLNDITYIRTRRMGEGAVRNLALEHARGSMVAFLTAGDLWKPHFLASQYVLLERHGYDLVYCDAAIFGNSTAYRRTFMEKYPSEGEADFASMLRRKCNVLVSGTLARRTPIEEAGMFETGSVAKPAIHLWLRMARAGAKFGYQREPLVKRRVFPEARSFDALARIEDERAVFERILWTIEMSAEDSEWVRNRLIELEGEVALLQGHSFLKSGDYTEAVTAFRVANRHQPSIKLAAMTLLTRVAPQTAARFAATRHDVPNEVLWYGR